ncbi:palmitoyltransferase ZDHHC2-like isoform X1 [Biomphalaria pfeifferi]|uniref:Palmitoyltransferase n=1 Tax=Biomphalaria pfeifferi TaxID=112525 RepID=A0AAD8B0M5_BIOPF|nr:palmitoyltransferase ZDHHC2-like isoform X1 [Biomphalaria pfeifferi]
MAPRVCILCCQAVKWAPVVFISAIVGWSYYAYVVQMAILTADTIAEKIIFLVLYHPILFLFVWSYYQTIFAKAKTPPKEFFLSQTEWQQLESETNENNQRDKLNNFAKKLPIQNRTIAGFPRYCEKCKCVKPDRCHHCSVCSICVLKMDHHCPWVNNCVGFHNYKYFVLFLGYALLYCIYVAVSSLKYFISFWSGGSATGVGRFHILFLFFVAVMFGISLISLFGYHIFLTVHNRSTLEAFRAPIFQTGADKDGFSLGSRANFAEVFGDKKSHWFLPIFTSLGDGVSYASRLQPTISYNTMGTTPRAETTNLGDGVTYPTRTVDLDSDGLLGQRQRWMEEGDTESSYENKGIESA